MIGSRFGDGIVEYKVGPLRRFAMRVLGWSVNRLSHQKFTDTSSGFRGFDARMLHYFAGAYPVEFMDSTESLLLACFAGFRVSEVPTRIRKRQRRPAVDPSRAPGAELPAPAGRDRRPPVAAPARPQGH